jgi:hypothetical protein
MCRTPGCDIPSEVRFCEECKRDFSLRSLDLMVNLDLNPKQLLIQTAGKFSYAQIMADYLGISLPTLYAWIYRYHGLSFGQFKQKYMCQGRKCIVVDYGDAGYSWKYTMADRIRAVPGGCLCFVRGSDSLLMTTLKPDQLADALSADLVKDDVDIFNLRYPLRLSLYTPQGDPDDE